LRTTRFFHLPLYGLSALLFAAAWWAYSTRVDVAVHARGVVRPDGETVKLSSEVSGRILQVRVHEGDDVRVGDLLLQFDDRELRLRERALLQQIHQTEERLQDLEYRLESAAHADETAAEVDTAEEAATVRSLLLNLDAARDRYRRSEQLFDEGLISRQSLDEARLALDRAESERDRPSLLELKRVQGQNRLNDLGAERIPLRSTVEAAYHDLEQCRIEITRRSIVSPVEGRITAMPKFKPGEFLSTGSLVASIAPATQSPAVEAWVPSADRTFVKTGQAVRMQVESVANLGHQAFDGTVASIAPDAVFNQSGAGAYQVLVRPAPSSTDLQLGMALQVHFITRQERLLWLLVQRLRREFEDDSL
jgi:multidrug resistance efflux pump